MVLSAWHYASKTLPIGWWGRVVVDIFEIFMAFWIITKTVKRMSENRSREEATNSLIFT